MTYQEFLEKLSEIKDLDWCASWHIRIRSKWTCPVCAVANHIIGKEKYNRDYHNANEEVLHLNLELTKKIVLASDARYSSGSQLRKFRNDMLKALQLQDR